MGPESGAAFRIGGRERLFLCFRVLLSALMVVALSSLLPAQVASNSPTAAPQQDIAARYQQAVQAATTGDLTRFEQLASTPQTGALRNDAMMWLVWGYRRIGNNNRAQRWAGDLLAAQPRNALALAVLADADQQLTHTSPAEPGADQPLSHAKQALRELDDLHRPEGMPDAAFAEMKTHLARTLNGAIGYAYFQRSDYVTARGYLRKAVALAPENAQYAYALSIADLDGRDPDPAEGFRMLARSVNLTQGTPAGNELATYARQRYKRVGGTDAVWDQYIANTRLPAPSTTLVATAQPPAPTTAPVPSTQPAAPASVPTTGGTTSVMIIKAPPTDASRTSAPANTATAASPATTSSSQPTSSASAPTATSPAAAPATTSPGGTTSTTSPTAPATSASAATATTPGVAANQTPAAPASATASSKPNSAANTTVAEVRAPDLPPARTAPPHTPPPLTAPPRPMVARRGTPVSLGILVQSTAASRETRAAVVNNLSDMVRHLRNDDEAFLISFSSNVIFEQDLTNNPQALEDAMDKIQPNTGTALFDAVAFAAGHLKRIAKNGNRLLLVISDGANSTKQISPMELSGDLTLSGVQIFCIGMQAATLEDQQRLRALADRTGGSVVFLNDTAQFRGATHEIAQRMGIPFE